MGPSERLEFNINVSTLVMIMEGVRVAPNGGDLIPWENPNPPAERPLPRGDIGGVSVGKASFSRNSKMTSPRLLNSALQTMRSLEEM